VSMVIDASLTLSWFFEDETTPKTTDLLDRIAREGAVAPTLWRMEVANGLQTAIRRRRIDAAYRDQSLNDLKRLPITIDTSSDPNIWTSVVRLSDRYGLTIYDACYLDLAERLNLPLATLDQKLQDAAIRLGLPTLGG
jgi:predicted nucleic acid-binding protein